MILSKKLTAKLNSLNYEDLRVFINYIEANSGMNEDMILSNLELFVNDRVLINSMRDLAWEKQASGEKIKTNMEAFKAAGEGIKITSKGTATWTTKVAAPTDEVVPKLSKAEFWDRQIELGADRGKELARKYDAILAKGDIPTFHISLSSNVDSRLLPTESYKDLDKAIEKALMED